MKAFKDDNEARLYGRFYARLSKYPDIKAIYAQTDDQEQSELQKGVNKALCVAFDLFEERETELNQKSICEIAQECKEIKSAPELYVKMLKECYPDIYLKSLQDEQSGDDTADFKPVAFDLFCALTEQARELNALRDENKRLINGFFKQRKKG